MIVLEVAKDFFYIGEEIVCLAYEPELLIGKDYWVPTHEQFEMLSSIMEL